MTSGVLTTGMAEAVQIPFATLNMFVRVLREERLVTTGARGVNAPPMTYQDAARILLALLVTDKPARAAEVVRDFGSLECIAFEANQDEQERFAGFTLEAAGLEGGHTLEEAVATLIEAYAEKYEEPFFVNAQGGLDGMTLPYCRVRVNAGRQSATINLSGGKYTYMRPSIERFQFDEKAPLAPQVSAIERYNAALDAEHELFKRYFTRIEVLRAVYHDAIQDIGLIFNPIKPDEMLNDEA